MIIRNLILTIACLAMLGALAQRATAGREMDLQPKPLNKLTAEEIKAREKQLKKEMKETKKRSGRRFAYGTKVKNSGKEMRNIHVTFDHTPGVEIVVGEVTGIDSSGIFMAGEYFDISTVEIIDEYMRPVTLAELHYGLKTNVTLEYGSITKVVVYGLKRMRVRPDFDYVKFTREMLKRNRLEAETSSGGERVTLPPEVKPSGSR